MRDRLSGAIIAAGRGERLRAAVNGVPKPLVELDGKTLLERQIESLTHLGAAPIRVIVNSETAAAMSERKLELPASVEFLVADTANSMESLLELGARIAEERFILTTVDALVAEDELAAFLEQAEHALASRKLDGALAAVRWQGDARPLFIELSPDGKIEDFGEDATDFVTAGIYLFSTRIFMHSRTARERRLSALRQFLRFLIKQGAHFAAIKLREAVDIDEAADLSRARRLLARTQTGGESG